LSSLNINLFGTFKIFQNKSICELKITRCIQGLFAYLLINRDHTHSKDILLELFWPDYREEKARKCLNTALWRLRSLLKNSDSSNSQYLVTTSSGEISILQTQDIWLDVDVFEKAINQIIKSPIEKANHDDIGKLEHAIPLYKGELLEGFYDDWVLSERERLRNLYVKALRWLMLYYKNQRNYECSVEYAKMILDLDPLREEIVRNLMTLYSKLGQRSKAIQQYELCRGILQKDLGIEPLEETQDLYRSIVSASESNFGENQKTGTNFSAHIKELTQQLQLAIKKLDDTCAKFEQIKYQLEILKSQIND
jgi:DNA-binding SARP family transcriptional activator